MLLRIGRHEAMRKKQMLQLLTMLTATAAVCGGLFLRHQPMEVAAVRVEKGNTAVRSVSQGRSATRRKRPSRQWSAAWWTRCM